MFGDFLSVRLSPYLTDEVAAWPSLLYLWLIGSLSKDLSGRAFFLEKIARMARLTDAHEFFFCSYSSCK